MASLNPSALQKLANWCISCGTFRRRNAGDLGDFYGEKPAESPVLELEPSTRLSLHDDVAKTVEESMVRLSQH